MNLKSIEVLFRRPIDVPEVVMEQFLAGLGSAVADHNRNHPECPVELHNHYVSYWKNNVSPDRIEYLVLVDPVATEPGR